MKSFFRFLTFLVCVVSVAAAQNVNVQVDSTTGVVWRPTSFQKFTVPSQTGHNGKFLTTNGTATSWATISGGGDLLAANNLSDLANAATARTNLGLAIGTNVQAYDADLTTYAGITPSANIQTFLGAADYAAMRTQLGLVIGTNVQAYDADLTTWAGVTPSANGQSLVAAANYAAMRGLLDLEAGTDFLAYPSGTPTGSKFLRDDNSWQTITGGGDMLAANNLSDLANAGTARTNLGATTVGSNIFTLTNPGAVTFLRLNADNTVMARSAANFKTDLSLTIGTDVQAYDADLAALAGLTSAADKLPYFTGSGTAAVTDFSSAARTLLDDASVSAMVDTLGGATATGTGGLARRSDPILLRPNNAIGALEIDVTKQSNTKTVTGDHTFTFSATPSAGQVFGITLTGDTSVRTITIPSSYSLTRGATITTFSMPISGKAELTWRYDGTTYFIAGEPTTINDLTTVTIATGDYLPFYDSSGAVDGKALVSSLLALGIDDTAYDATSWNGVTTVAPSKNAVRDKIAALAQADISGLTTADSPQLAGINVGHASDTTITRTGAGQLAIEGVNIVTTSSTDTLTNKTIDASATGNVLKMFGYLQLTHPTVFGSGATQQTTVTSQHYGQALFSNSADKATNFVEYICKIPRDIDTAVDLTGEFQFILGGADTNDHEYEISMIAIASSAVYDGALGNAVSLTYTADGSGADKDIETSGAPDTLTSWKDNVTAGRYWRIRVARDGDHASDTSTVNSYSAGLVIRYGITQ